LTAPRNTPAISKRKAERLSRRPPDKLCSTEKRSSPSR
jgi:hypothetical protein